MADKIIVMKDGVFEEIGFSEDLYSMLLKWSILRRLIDAIPKGIS